MDTGVVYGLFYFSVLLSLLFVSSSMALFSRLVLKNGTTFRNLNQAVVPMFLDIPVILNLKCLYLQLS